MLQAYHSKLLRYLAQFEKSPVTGYPYELLVRHFELCLVDYVRFMAGWGMWGNTEYAEQRTLEILEEVDGGVCLSVTDYDVAFRKIYCS